MKMFYIAFKSFPEHQPEHGKVYLCKGRSYDSEYQNGFLLARYIHCQDIGNQWYSGKQEEIVQVTEFAELQ